MNQRAPARGYVCVVCAVHAVELHDLPEATSMQFLRDMRTVSRALVEVTGAAKLNYEIHGNTIAHLHMHIYPRYPGDRFEGRPIDPRELDPPVYGEGEFALLRRALLQALD
ncbi:HIT domain-containing protein [Ramlibacter sp. XY19]|nr:HIT domain-containing protein [Ramlibacter paludis]